MSTKQESKKRGWPLELLIIFLYLLLSLIYVFLAGASKAGHIAFIFLFLAPLFGLSMALVWDSRHDKGIEGSIYMESRYAAVWSALPIIMNGLALLCRELEYDSLANLLIRIKFWSLGIFILCLLQIQTIKDLREESR